MTEADLAIVGAGPAGMAAAATAAERGLDVVVLDEQRGAGGQIYRGIEQATPRRAALLGADYARGATLAAALRHPRITTRAGAVLWAIEPGDTFRLSFTRDGEAACVEAARVLLATGALERPMPIPGWTLPGVMTAGAGQILLKQSGLVPRNAVLAGSGPLIYLLAAQMIRAGAPPSALIETQERADLLRAARHWPGALRGWRQLAKGLALLSTIRRAGVVRHLGARDLAIEGSEKAEAIVFTRGGARRRIACDAVLLHHGVVPNLQAARSIGASLRWDDAQRCFAPALDRWGETDVAGVFVAGDGAGIGGAGRAEIAGRLAALEIASDLGAITESQRDRAAAPLWRAWSSETAIRPFLDAVYPPYGQALAPDDETIVCRCEEVTAGAVRAYAELGCIGPNQAKSFGRAGMGPCQGRYCGASVVELLAKANGRTHEQTGYFRLRPPIKPVTLGELAAANEHARSSEAAEPGSNEERKT